MLVPFNIWLYHSRDLHEIAFRGSTQSYPFSTRVKSVPWLVHAACNRKFAPIWRFTDSWLLHTLPFLSSTSRL